MSNDWPNNSSEQAKADTAASDACTRSGAFILLLSVVLFLLIPTWKHRQKEIAFAHYASYRLSLELSLGALNDDPTWKTFRDSNRDPVSYSPWHSARLGTGAGRSRSANASLSNDHRSQPGRGATGLGGLILPQGYRRDGQLGLDPKYA